LDTRLGDGRLIELRHADTCYREMAATLAVEFGGPRKEHTFRTRHIVLATYEGGKEASKAAPNASPTASP
jgi:hypothetical protein